MVYCDRNDKILEWGSEEIIIPYRSPLDGRVHRYFPDFYVKVKQSDGVYQTNYRQICARHVQKSSKNSENGNFKFPEEKYLVSRFFPGRVEIAESSFAHFL